MSTDVTETGRNLIAAARERYGSCHAPEYLACAAVLGRRPEPCEFARWAEHAKDAFREAHKIEPWRPMTDARYEAFVAWLPEHVGTIAPSQPAIEAGASHQVRADAARILATVRELIADEEGPKGKGGARHGMHVIERAAERMLATLGGPPEAAEPEPEPVKPLPCPWCGAPDLETHPAENTLRPRELLWCVGCLACLANGPSESTAAEAVKAWNAVAGRM